MQNQHLWLHDCVCTAYTFIYKRKRNFGFGFASFKENILIWAHESSEIKGEKREHLSCVWLSQIAEQGAEPGNGSRAEEQLAPFCRHGCPAPASCGAHSVPISFSVSGAAVPAGDCWMPLKLHLQSSTDPFPFPLSMEVGGALQGNPFCDSASFRLQVCLLLGLLPCCGIAPGGKLWARSQVQIWMLLHRLENGLK